MKESTLSKITAAGAIAKGMAQKAARWLKVRGYPPITK
jgi:hypothetical protein